MRQRRGTNLKISLLTSREAELLRELSYGLTNKEIAARLFITEGTTKGHLHRIFRKLDVRNRTAAVAKARQMGLLKDAARGG